MNVKVKFCLHQIFKMVNILEYCRRQGVNLVLSCSIIPTTVYISCTYALLNNYCLKTNSIVNRTIPFAYCAASLLLFSKELVHHKISMYENSKLMSHPINFQWLNYPIKGLMTLFTMLTAPTKVT